MTKEDIKVSIIIPVYKVEQYLNQCVDSVINQTYKNIEVILVDDGSPDNCPEICDEYAKRDKRIKVIHKVNEGVSSARNIGLKSASGDYILFIDSDDWLEADAVKECISYAERYKDIGCVMFTYVKEYGENKYEKHIYSGDKEFLSKESFFNEVYRRLFGLVNFELHYPEKLENLTPCCMKMYRRDLAMNGYFISLEKIGSCEDGVYNILALKECDLAIYIDKSYYHYRYIKGSITTKYRPNLIPQWENLFEIMQKEIDSNDYSKDFQEALNNRIALSILGIGLNALSNKNADFFDNVHYIKDYLRSNMYKNAVATMKLNNLPLAWKFLLFFSKQQLSFFVTLILYIIKFIKSKM